MNRNYRRAAPGLITPSPAAAAVLRAIGTIGGRPIIVGGAVRDALWARRNGEDRAPKDIDIEVYGVQNKERLIKALSLVGAVDERGVSFGVIAVRVDGEDFDVTLPRTESPTAPGHRGFEVTIAPELDEAIAFGRRDFTINAMGYDPIAQELVDPYSGRLDLDRSILRHTTHAFSEDPLRVLRGMQLAGRFELTIAPETAALCRELIPRFHDIARERVWGEWWKLLQRGAHISHALQVLVDSGWITHFPPLAATIGVPQDPRWHPEGDVFTHLGLAADAAAAACERDGWESIDREIAVLGALVHDLGKVTHTQASPDGRITSRGHAGAGVAPAGEFLADIGAPGYLLERIAPLVAEHMCHTAAPDGPSRAAVRRLMRRLAPATIIEWAWVVDADCAGRASGTKPSPAAAWLTIASDIGTAPAKGILTGHHLIAAGMTPGPEFKAILAAALSAQDDGEFVDEAGALRWFADRALAAG